MINFRSVPGLLSAFGLCVLLVLPACAPTNGDAAQRSARGPVTAEEIQEAGIRGSALDALRQLRPEWLRSRTVEGQIRVYLDGSRYGNTAASLNGIPVQSVGRIERLSANAASTRFGSGSGGHPEGAIAVTTAR
jgi:hypothetical protein